jgi:hypothetical protein
LVILDPVNVLENGMDVEVEYTAVANVKAQLRAAQRWRELQSEFIGPKPTFPTAWSAEELAALAGHPRSLMPSPYAEFSGEQAAAIRSFLTEPSDALLEELLTQRVLYAGEQRWTLMPQAQLWSQLEQLSAVYVKDVQTYEQEEREAVAAIKKAAYAKKRQTKGAKPRLNKQADYGVRGLWPARAQAGEAPAGQDGEPAAAETEGGEAEEGQGEEEEDEAEYESESEPEIASDSEGEEEEEVEEWEAPPQPEPEDIAEEMAKD